MFNCFIKFKKICNAPIPVIRPSEVLLSGLNILLIFSVFYFAIFSYNEPWAIIKRDIIEFVLICFSLFMSWLIFWCLTEAYYKFTNKKLFPAFVYVPVIFLIIYSLMVGNIFLIKVTLLGASVDDIPKYFLRHIPYAFLIFCIYYYLENKKTVIDELLKKINSSLDKPYEGEEDSRKKTTGESFLILNVDGKDHKINTSHISNISVSGHYLDICCRTEESLNTLMVRKSLSEILNELPGPPFLRIHRSHIVNIDHISEIKKEKRKFFVILDNESPSIPVSRNNLERLLFHFN